MFQQLRRISIGAISVAALASCSTFDRKPPPGETAGSIYVSSPRVSGRERLINDRRAQDEWLQEQLSKVDQQRFDINGLIDTRSLAITAARVQARVDPAYDVYRAQQATNANLVREQGASSLAAEQLRAAAIDRIKTKLDKGEIDAKEAAAQLTSLNINLGALTVPPTVSTPPSMTATTATTATTAGTAAANLSSPVVERIKSGDLAPPSPAEAVVANVSASPIDLFRDKLAFREEIRNEMQENALDDTHDIHRHTLYRMTFDATLIPDDDTSAWGIIEVEVIPPKEDSELWDRYRRYLEGRLNSKLLKRADLLTEAMSDCQESDVKAQVQCAIKRTFDGNTQLDALEILAPLLSRSNATIDIQSLRSKLAQLRRIDSNDEDAPLDEMEAVVPRVIAGLLKREFDRERLACYFRLVTNKTHKQYPPKRDEQASLKDYIVAITAPDIESEQSSAKEDPDSCGYTTRPQEKSDFAKEFSHAITKHAEPRVYAVTPKETVQRLSDVSSRRAATEFVLGLGAIGGAGGVDAMLQSVRENDAFLQTLRRQPLVVGYTNSGATSYNENGVRVDQGVLFGWLLGPQFAITKDGSRPSFRHIPRQQALTAMVSLPVWWNTLKLKITGSWRRENPTLPAFNSSSSRFVKTYGVELPRRLSALDGKLVEDVESREPRTAATYRTTVQVGQPARLLIEGENMWKSAEVFLGSQAANRVRVLPNMGGVIAEFDQVLPSYGSKTIDISVATSDGFTKVGVASVASTDALKVRSALGVGRRFIGDQSVTLALDPPLKAARSVELWARSKASASMNAKVAELGSGLDLARDGASMRITPKTSDIKLKSGDPIDLVLVVGSDSSVAPEYIAVASDATYFTQSSDLNGKLEWASAGTGLRALKITFPPGAQTAFASLSTGKADIQAQISSGGKSADMERGSCTVGKTPCILKLRLVKPVDAGLDDAVKKGDFSLAVNVMGDDVPSLPPGTLSGR